MFICFQIQVENNSSNFKRCFSANVFNKSDPLPTVHHFTFPMGSSMRFKKSCFKDNFGYCPCAPFLRQNGRQLSGSRLSTNSKFASKQFSHMLTSDGYAMYSNTNMASTRIMCIYHIQFTLKFVFLLGGGVTKVYHSVSCHSFGKQVNYHIY